MRHITVQSCLQILSLKIMNNFKPHFRYITKNFLESVGVLFTSGANHLDKNKMCIYRSDNLILEYAKRH
jgi:hypothetical protein